MYYRIFQTNGEELCCDTSKKLADLTKRLGMVVVISATLPPEYAQARADHDNALATMAQAQ